MHKENITTLLASFATIKALSDAKKYTNPYQILSEFVRYIIGVQNLYAFSATEMKNLLNGIFGFDVPEAVVKSSCKSMDGITQRDHVYLVDRSKFSFDPSFIEAKAAAEAAETKIITLLSAYIREKDPDRTIPDEVLTQALIAFLVGDQQNGSAQHADAISAFVLKNQDNTYLQQALTAIQEGSILYIGLNHNINETGSITKKLTLFLGTEVLFSLAGYNGEIHKQLADDFFAQVRNANVHGEKILLRYFYETKQEIEKFFSTAEMIVEGKVKAYPTVAMNAIVNRCKTVGDVAVKQADFYHQLQYAFGIYEDDIKDYYSPEDNVYNLESLEYEDAQERDSWKFISHINKRRKGEVFANNVDSEYLLVTNTRQTLKASEHQTEKVKSERALERINDYAISLNRATNILWYKLGNGFGRKNYPNSVNAVLKARVILASTVSHNVTEVFNQANEEYTNGVISKEQLAARVITLQKKPILPEELEVDSIEDILDFSPEFISRYEEEARLNKIELEEKSKALKTVEEERDKQLKARDDTIAQKDRQISIAQKEKDALAEELAEYHKKDADMARKKDLAKRITLFSLTIFWKIVVIVIVAWIASYCEKKFGSTVPLYVGGVIELLGVGATVWTALKKDVVKYFPAIKHRQKEKQPQS